MQLKTLQIVWHGKEPVLSVDFQPNSHTLVSGGQDGEVKHWEVVLEDDGSPGVRFLSSYPVNSKSVNCVRFSPSGDMLASAGDKGEVLLWRFAAFAAAAQQQQQQMQRVQPDGEGDAGTGAAASASGIWRQVGLLRGHCDDVLDLAWAPDGSALLSGGIENNCILWDVEGRKSLKWLQDHGHYVQGVAWDPLGRYIASQSADRTARVYAVKPPPAVLDGGAKRGAAAAAAAAVVTSASLAKDGFYAAATLAKGPLAAGQQQPQQSQPQQPLPASAGAPGEALAAPNAGGATKQPLFCDDSLPTFFRRLAWSPDGAFLAAPAGVYRSASSAPVTSTTHVFSRGDWSGPALSLPCLSKGALVVRFCPRLFRTPQPAPPQLQTGPVANGAGIVASRLPYRIIMAVASVDSVILYDLQALEPLAVLGGIHFAAVTDLAWSDDGRFLVVASRDGYCTVCSFAEGELGEPVPLEDLPPGVAAAVSRAAARRHQERTAVAAAAAAAAKSAAAAAAAAAATTATAATAAPGDALDEQLSVAATAAPTTGAAPAGGASSRRIQPIPVPSGQGGAVAVQQRGEAAPGVLAGAKRPAEAEPTPALAGAATDRPKPKRIQPIPLSATALSAALPASGAGRVSGVAGTAAGTATAAAAPQSSTGHRRIVPTRVDGPSGTRPTLVATAAGGGTAAKTVPPPTEGLSPLQSAAPAGVSAVAAAAAGAAAGAAPSCTPLSGGGAGGVVVPGVAADGVAPGSGVKMPTPQVLVFGTPPGSALRDPHSAAPEPRNVGGVAAAGGATGQQAGAAQPKLKPKRVTPVPVDRGNRQVPGAAAQQPPTANQDNQPHHHQQQQPNPAAPPQAAAEPQDEGRGADAPAGSAAGGQEPLGAAAGASTRSGVGAAGGTGGGIGGASGARLSLAQLAAMRGAAAARKAAEGAP